MICFGPWQNLAAQCVLACNDDVNISLPGPNFDCELEITPEMLSTTTNGTGTCAADLVVELSTLSGIPLDEPIVDVTNIGQTLIYRVTHTPSSNSCWGQLLVEDKLRPTITNCQAQDIHCFQNVAPMSEGGDVPVPTFADCTPIDTSYTDLIIDEDCDSDDVSARIIRTWTVTDAHGNMNTCDQEIIIDRVTLSTDSPSCPVAATFECSSTDVPSVHPDATGYPYFIIDNEHYDVIPGDDFFCELASSYTDEYFDICGGGVKILRTWTVYDWCMPTILGTNPYSCIQVIKVMDRTAPVVTAQDTIFTNSNNASCDGVLLLPAANITDNCSTEFEVEIRTPVGNFQGNGGQLALFPVGTHTLEYYVYDQCENLSVDTSVLVVQDNAPPIAVCDDNTTVSLSLDGTAIVYAHTFDNGSYDNCEVSHFEVRRMASDCLPETTWDEFVPFECCEIGETVMVTFRVYDGLGNFNDCMIEVEVQDKLDPVISCPEDKIAQCTDNLLNLGAFGSAVAVDNCGAVISETSLSDINSCNTGSIVRIFTATDPTGKSVSCQQTITVVNDNPFDANGIIWPEDFTTNECGAAVLPDDLSSSPIIYDYPVMTTGTCDLVAASFEDQYLPIAAPACYKIIRTWTVVDWCQYDANDVNPIGVWSHNQVIKVIDTDAPVLDCPEDMVFNNFNDDCSNIFAEIPAVSATDCNDDLFYTYKVDLFSDGIGIQNNLGNNASGFYPLGTHTITFSVEDGCGNATTCDITIVLADGKAPTPVCINGISVDLMEMGVDGMVTMTAEMFNAGSYDNCTAEEDLDIEISPSQFTCANLGTNFVYLTVTDEEGNSAFCQTTLVIQDNQGICPGPGLAAIEGYIQNEQGDLVEDVTVEISGANMAEVTTGANGTFNFLDVPMHQDYSIRPARNTDHSNGVSTFDLVLMGKHILGIKDLDSPYKIIAADVNNSGNISTFDIVLTRKLILQITQEFQHTDSWRFVDANYVFPDPTNPFLEEFPEVVNINDLSDNELAANFVAIKVGDVNGNAATNNLINPEDRNNLSEFTLNVTDRKVEAGETFEVNFQAAEFKNIFGYQFSLNFDEKAAEFITFGAESIQGLSDDNFGLAKLEEGIITTSWDNAKNSHHNNSTNPTLFTLVFKAKTSVLLSEWLTINSRYTTAEAYRTMSDGLSDEILDVNLVFSQPSDLAEVASGLTLEQNQPNPFNQTTRIEFYFPKAGNGTLTVYDLSGRILKEIRNTYTEGQHFIELNRSDLNGTSTVLFYRLATPYGTQTRKMILL